MSVFIRVPLAERHIYSEAFNSSAMAAHVHLFQRQWMLSALRIQHNASRNASIATVEIIAKTAERNLEHKTSARLGKRFDGKIADTTEIKIPVSLWGFGLARGNSEVQLFVEFLMQYHLKEKNTVFFDR